MAEDKKKDGDGKAEGGKKKRLPAIVMIAIGAIVGGVGVVFAVPPKTIEKKVEEKPKEYLDVGHPDVIEQEFNPRTRAGKGVGRVHFKFRYLVREDRYDEAVKSIKQNWDEAKSVTLLLLKTRSMEELQSEAGLAMLRKDLIDSLDRALFPGSGDEKLAKVTEIVWDKFLLQ